MISPPYAQAIVVAESVRRLLDLRETLVRFDENLKAYWLLKQAPYFCEGHPALIEAREAQYLMTRHVLPPEELRLEDRDSDPYEAYYRQNVHENPFEVNYGIQVEEAHRIPRVQFLLDSLAQQAERDSAGLATDTEKRGRLRTLDLSANDGFMAARLSISGYRCDCLDLHPDNVQLAHERRERYPLIGRVEQGALEDAARIFAASPPYRADYDAVVCFETVEHVRSPAALLTSMLRLVKLGGKLYLSTPHGAVEQGNLPTWDHIEPKGHVRVYTAQTFRQLLETVGEVEDMIEGPDGVLAARVAPAGSEPPDSRRT